MAKIIICQELQEMNEQLEGDGLPAMSSDAEKLSRVWKLYVESKVPI